MRMERLRKIQQTIAASAEKLTVSQKLLIGTVLVLMVMVLLLVQLYAGRPEMVPLLPGKPVSEQGQAASFLQTNGLDYAEGPSGLMVQASRRSTILAQMSQSGALAGDNRILFNNLIEKHSWTMSQQQNRQLELIAVQNTLEDIITHMSGIQEARVIINQPERRGLSRQSIPPSASVTVFPTGKLVQHTIDAVAHLVASSRGIDVTNVRVIDGVTMRQHKVRKEHAFGASDHLELVTKFEQRHQQKLLGMLAYIPNVIVTVHAQVDATQHQITQNRVYNENEGSVNFLIRENTTETHDRPASPGGEAGVRSNVGQDIRGVGPGGASSEQSTSETEFTPMPGQETTQIVDPRGYATKINAVVNIPRSYFVQVWMSRQGDESAEPSDTDLEPLITSETTRIRGEAQELIDTSTLTGAEPGEVLVSMIPVFAAVSTGGATTAPGVGAFTVGGEMLEVQPLVKTVALGALAAVALGLVVFTALRSVKTEVLPSAAELVGLPPALENTSDLVGEAEEADSVLQGIELTDDEMRQRKVMEQVKELVDEKPEDASRLLSRWIGEG